MGNGLALVAVKPFGFRLTKKQDYKTEEESITV